MAIVERRLNKSMLSTLFLLNFENCMFIAILDNGTSIILLNNHKECSLL